MRPNTDSFARGAITLIASSVVVKIIGLGFKIPLAQQLGGEGMGLFMTAYSVFAPFYAVSAAGFSVAVARMSAADEGSAVLSTALPLFGGIGLLFAALLAVGAAPLAVLLENPDAMFAIRAIAPAVLFCSIEAVFRGYFEGKQRMQPTAWSEFWEAASKLVVGIGLAGLVLSVGKQRGISPALLIPHATTAALLGVSLSAAVGAGYLAWVYAHSAPTVSGHCSRRSLLSVAMPVCATALTFPLFGLGDLFLLQTVLPDWLAAHPVQLAAFSTRLAQETPAAIGTFVYGCYAGMAMTVFHLVPGITGVFGVCALPMVTKLSAGQKQTALAGAVESVLRLTMAIAIPASIGMTLMAEPILALLFPGNLVERWVAAPMLRMAGIGAGGLAILSVVHTILQALGKGSIPLLLLFGGAVEKLVLGCWLFPFVGHYAAPISTVVSVATMLLGALGALSHCLGKTFSLSRLFLPPLLGGALGCTVGLWGYRMLSNRFSLLLSLTGMVAISGILYISFLTISSFFRKEDEVFLLGREKKKFAQIR